MLAKAKQWLLLFSPETLGKPLAVPGEISFVTVFCSKDLPDPNNNHQVFFLRRTKGEKKENLIITKEKDGKCLPMQEYVNLEDNAVLT